MLSDFLFYKALFPASGGGSSEVSGGATTVVYHAGQEYFMLEDMIKISDLTPTVEELNGGFFIAPYNGSSMISFAAHPWQVTVDGDGVSAIDVGDKMVGCVLPKELAEKFFGDESLAGFYCTIASDSDLWYCWEKK